MDGMSRRRMLNVFLGSMLPTQHAVVASPGAAAGEAEECCVETNAPQAGWRIGVLSARPGKPKTAEIGQPGLRYLGCAENRCAALFAPSGLRADQPAPLIVLLHGAGGSASDILPLMQRLAEERKILLLAPQSERATWDLLGAGFGPDIEAIDRGLLEIFETYRVDPRRIAIAGFSDGASYALSVGLANGGLFSDVLAFSPGFMAPEAFVGQPAIFISHGREDRVLPIDRCSRRIVPLLDERGYRVDYREFDGGHVVPTNMVAAALERFLAPWRSPSPSKKDSTRLILTGAQVGAKIALLFSRRTVILA